MRQLIVCGFFIICYSQILLTVASQPVKTKVNNVGKPIRNSKKYLSQTKDQKIFNMEEGVKRPIRLPKEVLLRILNSGNIPFDCKQKLVKECFVGSKINLNSDRLSDLVVMGQSRMLGANTTTFWFFLKNDKGYTAILKTSANHLEIGPTKTKGFLDIVGANILSGYVITNVFIFEGIKYKLTSSKKSKI